jgi:thiamine-phosphate pyrophosphorylase
MKQIIITSPEPIPGEVDTVCRLLDEGIFAVHIRRPTYGIDEYRRLLDAIPKCYHDKLVIHDYYELCDEYQLMGIHLNRRHHYIPAGSYGSISCSCHTLDEVIKKKQEMDYVFLSPIFDSISKIGYRSAFPLEVLRQAAMGHVIDEKVFALGGITRERMPLLQALSFGGAVLMGDVWNR